MYKVEQEKLEIFEYRQKLLSNIDNLLQYGRKFQEEKRIGQMSLFGDVDPSVNRFELSEIKIGSEQAIVLSEKERDLIGLSLLYNKYDQFIIHDHILSSSKIEEIVHNVEENKYFTTILEIKDIFHKKSQYGNNYAVIILGRDGLEVKAFMFGDVHKQSIFNIFKNRICIVRLHYKNGSYMIKKIEDLESLDASKYLSHIEVDILYPDRLEDIRYYYWTKMRKKGPYKLKFKYKNAEFDFPEEVGFNHKDYIALSSMNCKIKLIRL